MSDWHDEEDTEGREVIGGVILVVVVLLVALLAGCASAPKNNSIEPDTEVQQSEVSLFDEAHRCEGIVKYQAEMQRGEMRSRLSCEWEVQPDEWGTW